MSGKYLEITAMHLDPIEKKPLAMYRPGSMIFSVGSWGCNMKCPWCQNDSISRGKKSGSKFTHVVKLLPEQIVEKALELRPLGNIGIAFTYNEPLIRYSILIETAKLIHREGMVNVIVSNGMAPEKVFREVMQHIDAMNIDLKTMSNEKYREIGGNLETVKKNIELAAQAAHVEITTLVVPGFSDGVSNIIETAEFIAGIDPTIPLHVTRFFPAGDMMDAEPTPISTVYDLAAEAGKILDNVFVGNC